MREINLLNINLNQIKIFLTVASTESITVTSLTLYISASAVSKTISTLEQELGLILFLRKNGRLKLTPAGKVLQEKLSSVNDLIIQAIQLAHFEQEQNSKPLRIGFPDSANPQVYLFPSIENFKKNHPDISFHFETFRIEKMADILLNKRVDVLFTPLYYKDALEQRGCFTKIILRYPLSIFTTKKNPLSSKKSVTISDLKSEKFVIYSPGLVDNYDNNVLSPISKELGNPLLISSYASSSEALVLNSFQDNGVFIGDIGKKVDPYLNMIRIPIENTESGVIIASRNNPSVNIKLFIDETESFWQNNSIL